MFSITMHKIVFTRIMLLFDMNIQFFAAICMTITIWILQNAKCLQCLDACERLYSLPHTKHATLQFLMSDGIEVSKKRIREQTGDFECPKTFVGDLVEEPKKLNESKWKQPKF